MHALTVDYVEQEDNINNIVSSWVSRTLYSKIIHIINRRLFWSKKHLVELNLIRVETNACMVNSVFMNSGEVNLFSTF